MHYLDHAATTPVAPEAAQAMLEVLTTQFGNPSAQYPLGQEAKSLVERCRSTVMHLDPAIKRFLNPQVYPVGMEQGLADLRQELARVERAGSGRKA